MTFTEYWFDPRFYRKRPNLRGSIKQAFGDNVYYRDDANNWHQQDSHHSYKDGIPNPHNIKNDTQTDRVLVGSEYAYWGGAGPQINGGFRNYKGHDICAGRNQKSNFPQGLVDDFVQWSRSRGALGYLGDPLDWPKAT